MYIPKHHHETDEAVLEAFIREHAFGVVVAYDGHAPTASHIPLELAHNPEGQRWLIGHVARANPLWRALKPEAEVLVIFSGPHTYISPRWYNHVNVPTWNYQAVHVYGKPHLLAEPEEARAALKRLVDRYEAGGLYRLDDLPPDLVRRQLNGIVAFRIAVERIEASFKLSQNRDDADQANIIAELLKRDDPDSHAIAELMARRCHKAV